MKIAQNAARTAMTRTRKTRIGKTRAGLLMLSAASLLLFAVGLQAGTPSNLKPPRGTSQAELNRAYERAVGLQTVYRSIYESVRPAVVHIVVEPKTRKVSRAQSGPGARPLMKDPLFRKYRRHFFYRGPRTNRRPRALGSGFIIDKGGLVVTNSHVVGKARNVKVKLHDGRIIAGVVRGVDNLTDVALIRIKPFKGITSVRLGDSSAVRVGDLTVAVGSPFGFDGTFTTGVVSAVRRGGLDSSGISFIQTDAPINQGNSGGPLVNIRGEVVGINRMIVTPSGGSVGIGFAIPVNQVSNVITSIRVRGSVLRPLLGVQISAVPRDLRKLSKGKGVFVQAVMEGTSAWKAGIEPEDIILRIDGKSVNTPRELVTYIQRKKVGDRVIVELIRDKRRAKIAVTLGRRKG